MGATGPTGPAGTGATGVYVGPEFYSSNIAINGGADYSTIQGNGAIVVGYQQFAASQGPYSIALGYASAQGYNGSNSIVLNAAGSAMPNPISDGGVYVNPMRGATGSNILYYNTTTKEVTYGANSGGGGGGSGLTWVSNTYNGNITLSGVSGLSSPGQRLFVSLVGDGSFDAPSAQVTIGASTLTLLSFDSFASTAIYTMNSGNYSGGTSIQINFSGPSPSYVMATFWVTTNNFLNDPPYAYTTAGSSPSAYFSIPNGYPLNGMLIVNSRNGLLNMTTAASTPSGWTSQGTATHSESSNVTLAAFSKATGVSSFSYEITNDNFQFWGKCLVANN
jgi:hypothetical protein